MARPLAYPKLKALEVGQVETVEAELVRQASKTAKTLERHGYRFNRTKVSFDPDSNFTHMNFERVA